MPDIFDLLPPFVPGDIGLFNPPEPLRLQFRHITIGGVSDEKDNIKFPWYWTQLSHTALNGKPNAIVTATPIGRLIVDNDTRSVSLTHNPHPVGVLYRELDKRWYIYNLGLQAMELSAEFHVAVHEDQRPS